MRESLSCPDPQTSEVSAFTREMINLLFLCIGNHSCSFDVKKMQTERVGLRIMDLAQFSDVLLRLKYINGIDLLT